MRAAVVGVGRVALGNYLPFLVHQPDIELGYWNRTLDAVRVAQERHGGEGFDSLDAVVDWQPDIVFVLTSEQVRLPIAQHFVEAGVSRLFLEKPLTAAIDQANVAEGDFFAARDFLKVAATRGTDIAINFNYRFFASTQAAIGRAATLGELTGVSARAHFACWSHVLDLLTLFGGSVARVSALVSPIERTAREWSAPDLTVAFEFESGGVGSLVGSLIGPWHHPLFDISLDFEGGRIRLFDLDGGLEVFSAGSGSVESTRLGADESRWDRYAQSFRSSIGAYLDSVRSGGPAPIPATEGLKELQFEAAIRRAVALGTTINVPEEFAA